MLPNIRLRVVGTLLLFCGVPNAFSRPSRTGLPMSLSESLAQDMRLNNKHDAHFRGTRSSSSLNSIAYPYSSSFPSPGDQLPQEFGPLDLIRNLQELQDYSDSNSRIQPRGILDSAYKPRQDYKEYAVEPVPNLNSYLTPSNPGLSTDKLYGLFGGGSFLKGLPNTSKLPVNNIPDLSSTKSVGQYVPINNLQEQLPVSTDHIPNLLGGGLPVSGYPSAPKEQHIPAGPYERSGASLNKLPEIPSLPADKLTGLLGGGGLPIKSLPYELPVSTDKLPNLKGTGLPLNGLPTDVQKLTDGGLPIKSLPYELPVSADKLSESGLPLHKLPTAPLQELTDGGLPIKSLPYELPVSTSHLPGLIGGGSPLNSYSSVPTIYEPNQLNQRSGYIQNQLTGEPTTHGEQLTGLLGGGLPIKSLPYELPVSTSKLPNLKESGLPLHVLPTDHVSTLTDGGLPIKSLPYELPVSTDKLPNLKETGLPVNGLPHVQKLTDGGLPIKSLPYELPVSTDHLSKLQDGGLPLKSLPYELPVSTDHVPGLIGGGLPVNSYPVVSEGLHARSGGPLDEIPVASYLPATEQLTSVTKVLPLDGLQTATSLLPVDKLTPGVGGVPDPVSTLTAGLTQLQTVPALLPVDKITPGVGGVPDPVSTLTAGLTQLQTVPALLPVDKITPGVGGVPDPVSTLTAGLTQLQTVPSLLPVDKLQSFSAVPQLTSFFSLLPGFGQLKSRAGDDESKVPAELTNIDDPFSNLLHSMTTSDGSKIPDLNSYPTYPETETISKVVVPASPDLSPLYSNSETSPVFSDLQKTVNVPSQHYGPQKMITNTLTTSPTQSFTATYFPSGFGNHPSTSPTHPEYPELPVHWTKIFNSPQSRSYSYPSSNMQWISSQSTMHTFPEWKSSLVPSPPRYSVNRFTRSNIRPSRYVRNVNYDDIYDDYSDYCYEDEDSEELVCYFPFDFDTFNLGTQSEENFEPYDIIKDTPSFDYQRSRKFYSDPQTKDQTSIPTGTANGPSDPCPCANKKIDRNDSAFNSIRPFIISETKTFQNPDTISKEENNESEFNSISSFGTPETKTKYHNTDKISKEEKNNSEFKNTSPFNKINTKTTLKNSNTITDDEKYDTHSKYITTFKQTSETPIFDKIPEKSTKKPQNATKKSVKNISPLEKLSESSSFAKKPVKSYEQSVKVTTSKPQPEDQLSDQEIEDFLKSLGFDFGADIQIVDNKLPQRKNKNNKKDTTVRPRPTTPKTTTIRPRPRPRPIPMRTTTTRKLKTKPTKRSSDLHPHKETEMWNKESHKEESPASFIYMGSHNKIFPGLYSNEIK